jgi:hypothetical protein
MQPAVTPNELIEQLGRELATAAREAVSKYNRQYIDGGAPDLECLIHPGERVRLVSRSRPSTLLIDIAADELAINIVIATDREARPGYPKQVPLRIVLEGGQPVLQTMTGTPTTHDVLRDAFAEFFRVLAR